VVDVSGSMSTEATMQNEDGKTESHGLSLLDVVKHAVRTTINTLGDNDRMSLVTFHSTARTAFRLIPMTRAGRARALKELDALVPQSTTNIWDGLQTALEIVREDAAPGRATEVLLLTDGVPNCNPPRGIVPTYAKYLQRLEGPPCIVNTFGFGYNLDTALLAELASMSDGSFCFIPDSSFVGTVFVNCLANILTTAAARLTINVTGRGDQIGPVIDEADNAGTAGLTFSKKGVSVRLGQLRYGHTRDIVLRMRLPDGPSRIDDLLDVTASFSPVGESSVPVTIEGAIASPAGESAESVAAAAETEVQAQRIQAVAAMRVTGGPEVARTALAASLQRLRQSPQAGDPRLAALLQDLVGEASMAAATEAAYTKWGRHYLPSLAFAHCRQICNNFKVRLTMHVHCRALHDCN